MWVILSDTRKKCWFPWYILGTGVFLLLLMQTVAGKHEGIEAKVWLWWAAHFLPAITLLLASTVLNRIPAKVISAGGHQALVLISWAYLLAILAVLLLEPFSRQAGLSSLEHFQRSWLWLGPINVVLILGYFLAFWRKTPLRMPDAGTLNELASAKATAAKFSAQQKQGFDLTAAGEFDAVFQLLKQIYETRKAVEYHEIVLLESEYAHLRRNQDLNTIDPDQAQRQTNRITMALLNYITMLD